MTKYQAAILVLQHHFKTELAKISKLNKEITENETIKKTKQRVEERWVSSRF